MLVFPAILLPLSSHFNLELGQTLALSFWMYLFFGVSALPWGMLSDRLGVKRLLYLYHGGVLCSALAAVFSLNNPLAFSIAIAGIGLFSGIYHPVGLSWIARSISRTSLAMAINGMFGNLGLAVAPLFAGVVYHFFGLHALYLLVAIINGSGLVLLLKNRDDCIERKNDNLPVSSTNEYSPFLLLLITMMLGGLVYRSTTVSLPAYLELNSASINEFIGAVTRGGFSENLTTTFCISVIYLIGMVGQYTGGRVGERYDLAKGYCLFHVITIPMAIGIAFTTDFPLIVFALLHSFFLLGMQPIENTLVSKLAPKKFMSSAYGAKFIVTFGVGALGVKGVEIVRENFTFSTVYLCLACVSMLLSLCILILISRFRDHLSKEVN